MEALPLSEWRRLFDVKPLRRHVAMTQALLPTLMESRGTVVNVSSVGGKVAMASYGAYAGSNFALEAISDALRREGADFGVKVVVIEPGAVTTEMTGRLVSEVPRSRRRRNARLTGNNSNRRLCQIMLTA